MAITSSTCRLYHYSKCIGENITFSKLLKKDHLKHNFYKIIWIQQNNKFCFNKHGGEIFKLPPILYRFFESTTSLFWQKSLNTLFSYKSCLSVILVFSKYMVSRCYLGRKERWYKFDFHASFIPIWEHHILRKNKIKNRGNQRSS